MKNKITLWEASKRSKISFNWWLYRVRKKRIQVEKADGANWITPEEYGKAIAMYNRELEKKGIKVKAVFREAKCKLQGKPAVKNKYVYKEEPLFKVEKGIPLPPARNAVKYPWRQMEVGDSFLIPCGDSKEARKKAANALSDAKKRFKNEMSFATRQLPEGVRVWRVE